MPMVWNAEADAKLLSAIVKVYNVKVSGEKLQEVAEIIGPECTPKALTHRLSKIRNLAKDGGTESTNGTTPSKPKATATPTKTSTPAKANGKGPKKQRAFRSPSPDHDDDVNATPASARPKRSTPKRDYSKMAGGVSDDEADGEDDDGGGLNKKVKIEGGEDIGEGLCGTADDEFD